MTVSGAARKSHEKRVLLDSARARLADRDANAASDTVALLRQVVPA